MNNAGFVRARVGIEGAANHSNVWAISDSVVVKLEGRCRKYMEAYLFSVEVGKCFVFSVSRKRQ